MLNVILYPFQANIAPLGIIYFQVVRHVFRKILCTSSFPYINTSWCSASTYSRLKPPKVFHGGVITNRLYYHYQQLS